jgi:hypothetical protein
MQPSPASGQPTQSETQRGIDTRVTAAVARLRDVQAAYRDGKATAKELLTATEEARRLRATPMKSAIDAYFAEVQS